MTMSMSVAMTTTMSVTMTMTVVGGSEWLWSFEGEWWAWMGGCHRGCHDKAACTPVVHGELQTNGQKERGVPNFACARAVGCGIGQPHWPSGHFEARQQTFGSFRKLVSVTKHSQNGNYTRKCSSTQGVAAHRGQ